MNALVQTTTGQYCSFLADLAVNALIDEVNLTPKPALVDQRGSGAHQDFILQLMERSARSLQPMFEAMTQAALDHGSVSQSLREENPEVARLQSFILPSMRMGMRLILKSLEVKSRTVKLQVT